jgi:hypothetical protein
MSHGGENGIIYTDYTIDSRNNNHKSRKKGLTVRSMAAFESYTTKEVFSALRSNRHLKNCHKIVVIQVIFALEYNFCNVKMIKFDKNNIFKQFPGM